MPQVLAPLFRVNKIGGTFVGPYHDALPDTIHEGIILIALAVAIAKSLTKVRHNPDVSDDSDDGGSDGEEIELSDSDDGTEFSDSDTAYSSDSEDSGDNGLCYEHWDETFVIEQEGAGKEEEE